MYILMLWTSSKEEVLIYYTIIANKKAYNYIVKKTLKCISC